MILLGRSSSIIWTGLLITGAGIAWASDKKGNKSEEDDKWATPDNTVTLAQLTSQSDKLSRRSSGKFVDMKDQCTDFVEAANLGVGKASDGKASGTQLKNFRQVGQQERAPRTESVGTSTHKYKNENDVCGIPICVEVDMVPKRFKSLCSMVDWMKENNHDKRVFMVQKGDCAHLIDYKKKNIGIKPWFIGSKAHGKKKCSTIDGCNTEICINDDGNAKTFPYVFRAYMYLRTITETQVIAVGLGSCSKLYYDGPNDGCIYTEWFDLDDPMSDDVEEESVPYAHMLVLASDPDEVKLQNTTDASGKDKTEKKMGVSHLGIHRSCPPSEIMKTEYMTNSGEFELAPDAPGNMYQETRLKLKCRTSDNKKIINWEYSYFDDFKKNVTCRDWKVRYCCKGMWGEAYRGSTDPKYLANELKGASEVVKVHKPERKLLFEGCQWKAIINTPADSKTGSDNELISTLLNRKVQEQLTGTPKMIWSGSKYLHGGSRVPPIDNFCKGFALRTRFIDVRVNDETSLPYDEVKNQTILKISAGSGFMCKGNGCKDYNVRYCCVDNAKEWRYGEWAKWGEWSKCDRECGSGYRHRTRKCQNEKDGVMCYEASDSAKRQEEPCNPKSCKPGETMEKFTNWGSWTECTQKRYRTCIHKKGCGKLKEGEKESQEGPCNKIFSW